MYTDRRYRNRESSSRSQSRYPSKLRYDFNTSSRSLDRNSTDKKRCFVCKKEGCWSINHPKEERQCSFKQYLEKEGNSEGRPLRRIPLTIYLIKATVKRT
jgi:hypothetical protein